MCESSAAQTQIMASTDSAVSVVQTNPRLTAASSLLQLHNGTFPNCPDDDIANPSDNTQSRFSPSMLNGTGEGGRCGAVHGQSYANRSAAGLSGSINRGHDPFIYSQPNMQNTICGLANAISSLQQGQMSIQQEYASMHTRQENITCTLEQVLSALQDIKDGHHTSQSSQINQNKESAQPAANSGIDCHSSSYSGSSVARYSGSFSLNNPGSRNSGPRAEYQTNGTNTDSNIDRHYESFAPNKSTNTDCGQFLESQTGLACVNRQSENHLWETHPSDTQINHSSPFNECSAETDRDYTVSRYGFINEGTAYITGNNSQRYAGQLNEAIQTRATFYKTPSYNRNTDGYESSAFDRRPELSDSYCFTRSRSGYKSQQIEDSPRLSIMA